MKPALLILIIFSLHFCASGQKKPPESVVKEVKTGRALAARLIKKFGLVNDETITKYVNIVGQNIASISSRQELNFRFGILATDEVNAFACPGGYILITAGAMKLLDNEAELAGILGHEISHIALFHSGKFEENREAIVDILVAALGPGGDIVSTFVGGAVSEFEKSFFETGRAKEMEFQADVSGLLYSTEMGYDPNAYLNYLKKIQAAKGGETLNKTHPPANERIQKVAEFIKQLKNQGKLGKERFKKNTSVLSKLDLKKTDKI